MRRRHDPPAMTPTTTVSSAILVFALLGPFLVGAGGMPGTPSYGARSASAIGHALPALPESLIGSGHDLASPLPDRRSEGDSGSRLSGSGSTLSLDREPNRGLLIVRSTSSGRAVDGAATSVGGRLLGLPAHPSNAPPAT